MRSVPAGAIVAASQARIIRFQDGYASPSAADAAGPSHFLPHRRGEVRNSVRAPGQECWWGAPATTPGSLWE